MDWTENGRVPISDFEESAGIFRGFGQWLFYESVHASFYSLARKGDVRGERRADMHRIYTLPKNIRQIFGNGPNPQLACQKVGTLCIRIKDGHHLCFKIARGTAVPVTH
jgi:hypothetical protein